MASEERHKKRYRSGPGAIDTLHRQVRALTGEIRDARRELESELPLRRRADVRAQAPMGPVPPAREGQTPKRKPSH